MTTTDITRANTRRAFDQCQKAIPSAPISISIISLLLETNQTLQKSHCCPNYGNALENAASGPLLSGRRGARRTTPLVLLCNVSGHALDTPRPKAVPCQFWVALRAFISR